MIVDVVFYLTVSFWLCYIVITLNEIREALTKKDEENQNDE